MERLRSLQTKDKTRHNPHPRAPRGRHITFTDDGRAEQSTTHIKSFENCHPYAKKHAEITVWHINSPTSANLGYSPSSITLQSTPHGTSTLGTSNAWAEKSGESPMRSGPVLLWQSARVYDLQIIVNTPMHDNDYKPIALPAHPPARSSSTPQRPAPTRTNQL